MAYPKFILTDSGEFRMGIVDMHRDLLHEGEDCYGGGFYEFDYTRGRLLLSGRSYDYGRPLWNLFDEIQLPEAYSGLTIIYSPDACYDDEPPLSDYIKLKYI